jgi:hypothetical protein
MYGTHVPTPKDIQTDIPEKEGPIVSNYHHWSSNITHNKKKQDK